MSRNAAVGKCVDTLDADTGTFVVLDDAFARDSRTVWFLGAPIPGADAGSFEALGHEYGRDRSRVYFGKEEVFGADPQTFERLKFPYSRDRRDVYCVTIPMGVADPGAFQVVRGGVSTMATLVHYLDDPGLSEALLARGLSPDTGITVGMDGVGQAGDQRFEGAVPVR